MMGFEFQDGRERLPDEEDIYDVNDIEEREAFERLLGCAGPTQEGRMRRRRRLMIVLAAVVIASFVVAIVYSLAR